MPAKQKTEKTANPDRVTIVGIGASAGGIEALREFFDAVPANLGVAYVVIVHLAPDHNSELAAIIGRRTKMPVAEVSDHKLELKPDHVYVISPGGAKIGDRRVFPLARRLRTARQRYSCR